MNLRILLALVLLSAGLMLAALLGARTSGDGALAAGGTFAGAVRPPIPPTPLTGLRDEEGEPVDLARFRGRPVVVTFLYSTCQDTCPIIAQQVRGAMDRLGHDVPALAIAVDPPRDTPASARRFLARQNLTGRLKFLTGDAGALQRQWRAYGMQPQIDDLEHSAHVVVLDGRGVQRVGWPYAKLTPEGLAQDLRTLETARTAPASAARAALSR